MGARNTVNATECHIFRFLGIITIVKKSGFNTFCNDPSHLTLSLVLFGASSRSSLELL